MQPTRLETVSALEATSVVAVVRVTSGQNLTQLASALASGGVRLVEITLTVPGALDAINRASRELEGEVIIGAGTVLDSVSARLAVDAGAAFIVAPTIDTEVIAMAHRYGVAAIPGALTPTEVAAAMSAGADAIKLFPGRVATPGYFTDVLGPLPQARLLPTGNVTLETAPQYIAAGAVAVGVGKALVDPELFAAGDWAAITERARAFCAAVQSAKEQRS